jgi:hypothetical protein
MGYSLTIGEAKIEKDEDQAYIYIDVATVSHDEAPAYGEPTDNTNMRWPSYTSWAGFARFFNLYDIFFDEEVGLIREHPGAALITKEHKDRIDEELEVFKKEHPNAVARYDNKEDGDENDANSYLVRLEWLKYWVDWALENCENPTFRNT